MSTRTALALVLLAVGFALAGCGFSPVYGTYADANRSAGVAAALDSVYIDVIPDRTGQKLRNHLIDKFYKSGNPGAGAAYRLSINSVSEGIYGLGITKDATATRSQIRLTTTLTLLRTSDGAPLIRRNISAVSSFNTLASQYTTLVTEEDARDQAITDLAQQVSTLVELYFSNPSAFPAPGTSPAAPIAVEPDRLGARRDINDF